MMESYRFGDFPDSHGVRVLVEEQRKSGLLQQTHRSGTRIVGSGSLWEHFFELGHKPEHKPYGL